MAVGDGASWDHTTPTDATTAISIDDYNRDLRIGVQARMAHEHEWPTSQSATSEGGKHKWITFQANAAKPTLAGTQVAAVYIKTDDNLYFEKSAGTEVQIVAGTAVGDGKVLQSATDTSAGYLIDKIDGVTLTASGTNVQVMTTYYARIISGSYTGDGGATQAITSPGITGLSLVVHPGTNIGGYLKMASMAGAYARYEDANVSVYQDDTFTINGTGFVAGDATGGSGDPNANGVIFHWILVGR